MAAPAFEALGVDEAESMLDEIARHLSDLQGAEDQFDAALRSAYTLRWREWAGELFASGRLFRSFTSMQGGGDALRKAHIDSVEFGSTVPYARFHSGRLLEITPRMQEAITTAVADYYAPRDPWGR